MLAIITLMVSAAVALLVLLVTWRMSGAPRRDVWTTILVVSIAVLLFVGAFLNYLQGERSDRRQASTENAMTILKRNSESDERAKVAQAHHDQEMRDHLQAFISEGIAIRDRCPDIGPSKAEISWMSAVERYLEGTDKDDAAEFLHSAQLLPGQQLCFPRVQGYVSVLQNIRDRISGN